MKIKICQMGENYTAPLSFRILSNGKLTYCTLINIWEEYAGFNAEYYIGNKFKHIDYGNFIFKGDG